MSTFELYMLASGWDGLSLFFSIIAFLWIGIDMAFCIFTFADEFRKKFVPYLCLVLCIQVLLIAIACSVPKSNEMIKVYSAKYGSAKVQEQLKIFKEGN